MSWQTAQRHDSNYFLCNSPEPKLESDCLTAMLMAWHGSEKVVVLNGGPTRIDRGHGGYNASRVGYIRWRIQESRLLTSRPSEGFPPAKSCH